MAVAGMAATVELEPADDVVVVPGPGDAPAWVDLDALCTDVDRHGLGTGTQLLTATIRTFCDVLDGLGLDRPGGFQLRYSTGIPRAVGLAGSSALVLAALSVLGRHAGLTWPAAVLPPVALGVETGRLGIAAGLQDRVVQSRGGLVAMDFSELRSEARFGVRHGEDEAVDPERLPALFLGWRTGAAEPSDGFHRVLRARFDDGDAVVRRSLQRLAALVLDGRAALRWGDTVRFGALMAENMAIRRTLAPVAPAQLIPIDRLSEAGIPATFTGSGGAVVGLMPEGGVEAVLAAVAGLDVEIRAIEAAPAHPEGVPVVIES